MAQESQFDSFPMENTNGHFLQAHAKFLAVLKQLDTNIKTPEFVK